MLTTEALDIESTRFWLQVGTAVLCGASIGVERQLRGKAAGIRTSILVCLGTALFVSLGDSFPTARADPSRVLGQVITGIGFLGAGVIIAQNGRIIGVTSAAVIWMLAALGGMIGLGHRLPAMVLTLVTLGILIGVEAIESMWTRLREGNVQRSLNEIHIE